jgi:hypothetical protein
VVVAATAVAAAVATTATAAAAVLAPCVSLGGLEALTLRSHVGRSHDPLRKVGMHNARSVRNARSTRAMAPNWRLEMVIGPFYCRSEVNDFKGMWRACRGLVSRRRSGLVYALYTQTRVHDARYPHSLREFVDSASGSSTSGAYKTRVSAVSAANETAPAPAPTATAAAAATATATAANGEVGGGGRCVRFCGS